MFEVPGVFGVWWGGAGYGPSKESEQLESFGSMEGAKEALRDRYAGGMYFRHFEYLLTPVTDVATPAVEWDSRIELYRVWIDAGEIRYEQTDVTLTLGPRGGVKIVRG